MDAKEPIQDVAATGRQWIMGAESINTLILNAY